jgi:hypothetical protein
MTDVRTCLQQVRRLRATNYFSTLDEASIGELAKMLSFAENEIVAVAVINIWLEEQTERPTPADLRRLVEAQNALTTSAPKQKTATCAICGGTGFEIVERGGLTGARICVCRGGERAA